MTNKLILMLLIAASSVWAQGNSLYSRLGAGDVFGSTFQQNQSLAGGGVAVASGRMLNVINPASYANLNYVVGETGLFSSTNFYSLNGASASNNFTNLAGFAFGFPLNQSMGLGFGIRPYSKKNYAFSIDEDVNSTTSAVYDYFGDGGLSQVFFGWGGNYKNVSLGLQGLYYFGRTNDAYTATYDSDDFQNVRFQNFTNLGGFNLEGGLQYQSPLKEEQFLSFGGTFTLGNSLTTSSYTKANYFTVRTLTNNSGDPVPAEIHDQDNYFINTESAPVEGTMNLPFTYQAGVQWGKSEDWGITLDYQSASWDEFTFVGTTPYTKPSSMVSLGAFITPNESALGRENYWKSMSYRLGVKYGLSPIVQNGVQIPEYGMNIGFGLPLKKFKFETDKFGSYVFLTLGYAHRGNGDANLLNEDYFNLNATIILNDKWFIKRKFQ